MAAHLQFWCSEEKDIASWLTRVVELSSSGFKRETLAQRIRGEQLEMSPNVTYRLPHTRADMWTFLQMLNILIIIF